jgi:pullulanase/glycogen debranching enzyme
MCVRSLRHAFRYNFALFSEHAEKVELCLFDFVDATKETERITLPDQPSEFCHSGPRRPDGS